MPMIPLFGESYETAARSFSTQRLNNWYPEVMKYGKSEIIFRPTPGSVQVATVSPSAGSGCRGLYFSSIGPAPDYSGRLYGVWGNSLFRFSTSFVPSLVGTIGDNNNPVRMCDDGTNLYIVDGGGLYRCLLDSADVDLVLVAVLLPPVPGTAEPVLPDQGDFVSQRVVINSRNSNQWLYSDVGVDEITSSPTIDADNFYSAEQNADKVLGLKVVSGNIWLWGLRSTEIWRGTGIDTDPFSWVGGSGSQIGCKSAKSIASIDDKVFWLGASDVGENAVYMGAGLEITKISTNAVEDVIRSLSNADDARGFCFDKSYCLTFKNSNVSLVYDVDNGMWHNRSWWNVTEGIEEAWEPMFCSFAYSDFYYGSLNTNVLLRLDQDSFLDSDGRPIVREAITPVYFNDLNNWQLREISLDMEVGMTPALSGQAEEPRIMLQVSRDGGMTYGPEMWKSIGRQGQYRKTVRWFNLGTGRNIVLKFRFSDPAPCTIYQGRLIGEPCGRT